MMATLAQTPTVREDVLALAIASNPNPLDGARSTEVGTEVTRALFSRTMARPATTAGLEARLSKVSSPVVATVALVVVLLALLFFAPRFAGEIAQEDGPVEWLQVAIFAGAGIAALVAARRPPAAPDVCFALLFGVFVELEVDFDRRLFGRSVIDKRFIFDGTAPPGPRLLAAVVMIGFVIAVALYAWRRRRELVAAARVLPFTPSGRVLLSGMVLMTLVQIFEKRIARLVPRPTSDFIEESLELIAAALCFMAMVDRARRDKR